MSNIKIIEETLSQCSFFKDEMILQINEAFEDNKPIPNFISEKNNLDEEELLNDISAVMNLPFLRLKKI